MFTTVIRLYNQSLEYFSRNGCTIYTLFMILQLQWGIIVQNIFIIRALESAKRDKKWYEAWGAYFAEIYQWFCDKIFERTEVVVKVKSVDIMSNEFVTLINQGHAFGLGLKDAGAWYSKAAADGIITDEEVFKYTGKLDKGHNHCYYNGYIVDSLGFLKDKTIKMSIQTLREAVKKGIYYSTARTLIMEDKELEKALKVLHNKQPVNGISKFKLDRATKLRLLKK